MLDSLQGFMMENRIPSLKCDSDVFVTFEGDNMVMLQVLINATYTSEKWSTSQEQKKKNLGYKVVICFLAYFGDVGFI